jgi:hypothetical protein
MTDTFLVLTSIANDKNVILNNYATSAVNHNVPFIVVGDKKSPTDFSLQNCDYYSVEKQQNLTFQLTEKLPFNSYSRKNLGYLIAISKGAKVIIETDDDNIPYNTFWDERLKNKNAHLFENCSWLNVYKYFTDKHIWPRGYSLNHIKNSSPELNTEETVLSPIQQGLADENPDVDAIYRLTLPLPITFNKANNIAIGINTFCPFNSQNTTWFKEAFPLLYLPSYCSFRMTDIWRSFIAQRIAWACDWKVLFHESTVKQQRNEHNLIADFKDEIVGYNENELICATLKNLNLKKGTQNINENMLVCYDALIKLGVLQQEEKLLLTSWLNDLAAI